MELQTFKIVYNEVSFKLSSNEIIDNVFLSQLFNVNPNDIIGLERESDALLIRPTNKNFQQIVNGNIIKLKVASNNISVCQTSNNEYNIKYMCCVIVALMLTLFGTIKIFQQYKQPHKIHDETVLVKSNKTIRNNINKTNNKNKKPVRIYVDGCWDVMHSGHYNALRQAKALGDILVVGVHSDAEITNNKREPVMNNKQRMASVNACKWVDEVIFDVPYSPTIQLLNKLNCDYIAHGDDMPMNSNGQSAFHAVVDRLKIFRRTPGISTTHLIQRLLDATKYENNKNIENIENNSTGSSASWSSFLASSSRISAFSNTKVPTTDDIVVYIDGIFDLFHIGHIGALKKAKELGSYLYVGLYSDEIIRKRKGYFYPFMNLQERVLNVLSCKYVDDVVIGSPFHLTQQIIKSLNISYVVTTINTQFAVDEFDRYKVAKEMNIYKELKTDSNYTTSDLIKTIIKHERRLENQNKNRIEKAIQYVKDHKYIQEK